MKGFNTSPSWQAILMLVDITLEEILRKSPLTSKMTVNDEGKLGILLVQLFSQAISDEFISLLYISIDRFYFSAMELYRIIF